MVNFALVASLVLGTLMPSPSLATPVFDLGEGSWGGMGTPVRLTLLKQQDHDLYHSKGNTWLSSATGPGLPGDVVVGYQRGVHPFYVQFGQLYSAQNSSHVLYANVVNVTDPSTTAFTPGTEANLPYQVAGEHRRVDTVHTRVPSYRVRLSKKKEGLPGRWLWNEYEGSLQFQAKGSRELSGNFWTCADRTNGHSAIFLDLDGSMTYPITCTAIKLVQ